MQSAILPILTFLAVMMCAVAVFSLLSDVFLRDKKRVQERSAVEFHNKQREKVKRSLLFKDADPFQVDPTDGARPPQPTWSEWLQLMLDQSGLELTQIRLLYYSGGVAVGCGLVTGLLMRSAIFISRS